MMDFNTSHERRSGGVLPFLLHYRQAWGRIAVVAAAGFLGASAEAAALALLVPVASAIAAGTDTYAGELGPFRIAASISEMLLLSSGLLVGCLLLNLANVLQVSRLSVRWETLRRRCLIEAFLKAGWPSQSVVRSGHLQEWSQYVTRVSAGLTQLCQFTRAVVSVSSILAVAFWIDHRAALSVTAIGVILSLGLRPLTQLARRYASEVRKTSLLVAEELGECRRLSRDFHSFGVETEAIKNLGKLVDLHSAQKGRAAILAGISKPVYQHSALLFVLAGLGVCAVSGTGSALHSFGAVVLLALRSLSHGQALQGATITIANVMPFIEQLEGVEAGLRSHRRHDGHRTLNGFGSLSLDQVGYDYPGAGCALDDVSLTVGSGEIVGVIGPSGSGKTTLAQILLRLRAPTRGRLLVSGDGAEEFSLSSWTRLVAWVPQNPVLLHGTVLHNIQFLRDWISPERAVDAAKASHIHESIMSMPKGYDTQIGESSRDLSGGQVQRIAIARALAGNPALLVLDEPTSALDPESESLVQKSLEALRGRMTVVIIAHRLSTLRICSRVVCLRHGKVEYDRPLNEALHEDVALRSAILDHESPLPPNADSASPPVADAASASSPDADSPSSPDADSASRRATAMSRTPSDNRTHDL